MHLLAAKSDVMPWNELIRALVQSVIEEHGGLQAAVVLFALFSIGALLYVQISSTYQLRVKDKEIKRLANEKHQLEKQVLQHRISSLEKKHKVK